VGRAHGREGLGSPPPHVLGHDAVAKDAVRDQEARQDGRLTRDAALAVARQEALVEIGRHDPELGTKLGHIPPVLAEDPYRRRAVRGHKRSLVVGEQADEHGLPGPVGAQDRRMLALPDGQAKAVEDAPLAFNDRRVEKLENGFARQAQIGPPRETSAPVPHRKTQRRAHCKRLL
jgi:hypothetical protein